MADKRVTDALAVVKAAVASLEAAIKAADIPSSSLKPPKLVKPPMLLLGAGRPPSSTQPASMYVGAVSHMAWHWSSTTQQSQLAQLNTIAFRDELNWKAFETAPGSYDVNALSEGIQKCLNGTIDVSESMLTLGYGNPLYGSTRPLTTPNITAFANFCAAAVSAGAWRFPILQIWNEWNLNGGDPSSGSGGTAAAYKTLFDAAAAAMRAAGYTGKIITTGLAPQGSGTIEEYEQDVDDLLQEYLDAGILENADGLGLHPYTWGFGTDATSELVLDRIERAHTMAVAARGGQATSIYVTEWGWPVVPSTGTTDSQVGTWIKEVVNGCRDLGYVRCMYIYQLRDESSSSTDAEQNFGMFTSTGAIRGRGVDFSTVTNPSDDSGETFYLLDETEANMLTDETGTDNLTKED